MLGRLIYVLIIAAVVLAGGFAFDFLANEQGGMIVEFGDRQWTFTLFEAGLVLALGILAILLAIWAVKIVIATVRLLLGDGAAFDGFFRKWREKRGLAALSKAMVALEAGDAKLARKKAELAERKLNNPDLTRLISAKAAEMVGDTAHAETYYKALMDDPKTAFVGARGLLNKALADGNSDRALKLARHAQSLRPKDEGTLETLYALQSRKFDWAGARKTLQLQKRAGFVPKLEAQRREAALTYAQAEDAEKAGDTPQARALAVEAARKDPGNVEAVTSAVRLLLEEGSKRAASKLVQNAWRTGPDSRLAAAYASIEPDEAPAARRRRFEVLFALQPDHRETRLPWSPRTGRAPARPSPICARPNRRRGPARSWRRSPGARASPITSCAAGWRGRWARRGPTRPTARSATPRCCRC